VGPRYGLGLGGVAALLCGLLAYRTLARIAAEKPARVVEEIVVSPGPLTPR
jgi:hypothetical protein